jgi:hypothetical protein
MEHVEELKSFGSAGLHNSPHLQILWIYSGGLQIHVIRTFELSPMPFTIGKNTDGISNLNRESRYSTYSLVVRCLQFKWMFNPHQHRCIGVFNMIIFYFLRYTYPLSRTTEDLCICRGTGTVQQRTENQRYNNGGTKHIENENLRECITMYICST